MWRGRAGFAAWHGAFFFARVPNISYFCIMKKILPAIAFLLISATASHCQTFPFQDTSLGVDERVEDLLSRLTLDEKLSLMEHRNPAIPSLGLPAYSWWNEALHGVARNGLATVWPMPIALAASFDTRMVFELFSEVSLEGAVKRYQWQQDSAHWADEPADYHGLTFFTPNINIFRDPRWGRGMETYGEDPCLTARMGLACVQGLQHCYLDSASRLPLDAAACLKHFAVHSGPEGSRHQFDARVSPRDLWTTYLPAFEYIIRHSDVQQVMCGYNRLNGTPCCTNRDLLVDILRNKWRYDGLLVTDCWALNDCWERDTAIPRHETHASAALAAADAFGSEVDLECGSGLQALRTALDSGYLSEAKVNEHVRRILRTRLRLQLPDERELPATDITPADAASECLVLLKNDGHLLPLQEGSTKIYLAGPNAADTLMPLGNYNGTPRHTVSIREGLAEHFTLVATPKEADAIVYAGGLNPQLEGEELPIDVPGFCRGDRTRIELPADQAKALLRLQRHRRPVVLLLCSGSAVALDKKALRCDAILACWYGGEAMGTAVGRALAGYCDAFGRLPVTFYRSTAQLPPFDCYDMQGRTYRYMDQQPLFPFGYGLSYADYTVQFLAFDTLRQCCTVRLASQARHRAVATRWKTPPSVVLKAYAVDTLGDGSPRRQLIGFCRHSLPPEGESVTVEIPCESFWLRRFDEASQEPSDPSYAGYRFEAE